MAEEKLTIESVEEMRAALKAAEDEKRKETARAAMREKEEKRAAAKAAKEAKKAEPEKGAEESKPQYPHPGVKVGMVLQREKQEEFLLVVNRDMFYKLAVQHIMRAPNGYAIPNMRHIAAALGITDYEEAQQAWRKIQAEHERRIQYA